MSRSSLRGALASGRGRSASSRTSSGSRRPDRPPAMHIGEQALADLARLVEVLHVDARRRARRPRSSSSVPERSASTSLLTCFVSAPFLEPDASSSSARSGCERLLDLLRGGRDLLVLARGELAVGARRGRPDELADLLRSPRSRRCSRAPGRCPSRAVRTSSSVGSACSSAQLFEAAGPEVVVLVEALVLALGEVVAAALEPLLERGERLVAVDVDLLATRRLTLSSRSFRSARARLVVDGGDDRGGEVERPSRARAGRCRAGSRCGSGRP